nr:putative ribonuclease h protein [Quercus suber]POF15784.1 putative ribonuclease h protein [Quercus suber]
MDCASSNKGSFTWKSLLQACQVIDLGSRWKIGDGQSIRIRDDRWLPKIPATRIVSPSAMIPPEAKVSELINEDNHAWRSALIMSEFLPHEATMILGIPLSYQNVPDKQVWFPTPNGDYSTRSAYHLLSNVDRSKRPSCSNPGKSHRLWNGIWGLQIPHKVVTTALCPRCKFGTEDTIHALWTCPSLLVMWSDDEMLTKLLSKRNLDRLGEPSVALGKICDKAATLLHDFRTVMAKVARWTPPLSPHLKINFDGATFKELGCVGISVVVRNSIGAVISALSQ